MQESNSAPGGAAPRRRARKRFIVLLIAFLAAGTLLLAEVAARFLTTTAENGMPSFGGYPLLPYLPEEALVRAWQRRKESASYVVADAELGWTLAPNAGAGPANGNGRYETNAQGARAPRDRVYAPAAPPGKTRIVAVGDSFTHGDEVAYDETWEVRLEALRPDLEVVNFGVPGYGTDQAMLRWRKDGRALNAGIAVLGIWPENICRNLNVVRYYLNPAGAFSTKPRFVHSGGGVILINSPVLAGPELASSLAAPEGEPLFARDRWYLPSETTPRAYQRLRVARVAASLWNFRARREERRRLYSDADPAGNDLTVAIAKQFSAEAFAAGSRPLILIMPMRDLLEEYSAEGSLPLVRKLRAAGLDVLDPTAAMAEALHDSAAPEIYLAGGHFSPRGNLLLAEFLAAKLAAAQSAKALPR